MDKQFKLNEAIEFGYQAPNATTGLVDVVAEIYLPNKTKDIVNFPDIILAEVADTGTYRGSFIPNELGVWQVIMHLGSGDGQVNKAYSVGNYNLHEIGLAVDNLQFVIDALGDVATDGDVVVARDAITSAISALHNIDSAGVQVAAQAAIDASLLATAADVSGAQSALAALINSLPDATAMQA
ncbi:MAG: hypothetical protein IMZ47_01965, partial [Firmicutes bacterium]|nr:hypothetical protein [Bacillota bacterium]